VSSSIEDRGRISLKIRKLGQEGGRAPRGRNAYQPNQAFYHPWGWVNKQGNTKKSKNCEEVPIGGEVAANIVLKIGGEY